VISKKIQLLFILLITLGMGMKVLSPKDKLDIRFNYTTEEAQLFFEKLTPIQSKNYFYAELLDLGFMGVYGLLSFFLFKRFFPGKYRYFLFLPAMLDFVETTLILGWLSDMSVNLHILTWSSTLKWVSGACLILCLIYRYLRERQIDA
jgi:hypothetical protein